LVRTSDGRVAKILSGINRVSLEHSHLSPSEYPEALIENLMGRTGSRKNIYILKPRRDKTPYPVKFSWYNVQGLMHKVRTNYSSCTARSSENICSSSRGAQEKGKTG
jgi:hypothetical protein